MTPKEIEQAIIQREITRDRMKRYGDPRSEVDKMSSGLETLKGLENVSPEVIEKLQKIINDRLDAQREQELIFEEEDKRRKINRLVNPEGSQI